MQSLPALLLCLFFFGDNGYILKAFLIYTKALPVDLNMKFISKFYHGFTNRDGFRCAIVKALYDFKE